MAIIKPIDEVHIARPATPGTDRQLAGHMGLRSGREGGRFLATHANPLDVLALANFLQQAIERIAHHTVNPLHAGASVSIIISATSF
jgi:hypothetical protein